MNALLLAVAWFAAFWCSAFPLTYCVVAPWWRYPLGRILFGVSVTMALIVDLTLWQAVTTAPQPVWMPAVAVVLFGSLGVHMFLLTLHLIRAQHKGRKRDIDGSS